MGHAMVRLRFIFPEKGEMKALAFYAGQVALPLLIFNTVATADLGHVNPSPILACTLGKLTVYVLTWFLTYFACEVHRGKGQRVLTATVFSFFSIASNDFALGYPVVKALYDKDQGMEIYITANAVVGSSFFAPVTMVLFAIGTAIKRNEGGQEKEGFSCVKILVDVLLNPVITCTILGMAYAASLSWTLQHDEAGTHLPPPFSDGIKLFTSPFTMMALFLTGTTLRSARMALWPWVLVLMKGVVCAYASYFFGTIFVSEPTEERTTLVSDFTFFYGSIPASAAPLVFASQFDPSAGEQIAVAVLYGMILAGPIMFFTSIFMQDERDMSDTLNIVQLTCNYASCVLGGIFVGLLVLMRGAWGWHCPAKQLLAWYGCTVTLYSACMLFFNPKVNPEHCQAYSADRREPLPFIVGWLQNACRLMLLAMQVMMVYAPRYWKRSFLRGAAYTLACMVLAVAPAFVVMPSTVNEICEVTNVDERWHWRLMGNYIWSMCLLTTTVVVAVGGIRRVRREARAAARRRLDSDTDQELELETAGAAAGAAAGTVAADSASPSLRSLDGGSLAAESVASSLENDSEDDSDSQDGGSSSSDEGHSVYYAPLAVFRTIVLVGAVRFLTQVVNCFNVLNSHTVMGSFAQMLVLESCLEHCQILVLIGALLYDDVFVEHFTASMPAWGPPIFRAGLNVWQVVAEMVEEQVERGMEAVPSLTRRKSKRRN